MSEDKEVPTPENFLEVFGTGKAFKLKAFEPFCWYMKTLDWFLYVSRDCAYVATRTTDPRVELLQDNGETIGIKITGFSTLSREHRHAFMDATGFDMERMPGFTDLLIQNANEDDEEISKCETEFLEEMRRIKRLGLKLP